MPKGVGINIKLIFIYLLIYTHEWSDSKTVNMEFLPLRGEEKKRLVKNRRYGPTG